MRVNSNINMQSRFLNAGWLNKAQNQNSSAKKSSQESEGVVVTLSSFGKADGVIQSLMDQKQQITESQNNLIGRTLDEGLDMESIKPQLEEYKTQLEAIDTQISQTISLYAKQQNEKQKGINYKTAMSEKSAETERSDSIIGLSSDLNQIKTASSVQTRIDGETRTLESEIKLDRSRGYESAAKEKGLADLKERSANLTARIGGSAANVRKKTVDGPAESNSPDESGETGETESGEADRLGGESNSPKGSE